MGLFYTGIFTLHSGGQSNWKIDCDALDEEDLYTLSLIAFDKIGPWGEVVGIHRGGVALAEVCRDLSQAGAPRLVVDDVLTTGRSMEEYHEDGDLGLVIFARGPAPDWVTPLFLVA